MTCFIQQTEIDGVVRLSGDADFPRPYVGILGSVHGNEPCGQHAISRLHGLLEAGEGVLERGTVYLIHANPVARKQGMRFTQTGADLNRILDFGYVERLNRTVWGYEHHRALELRPLVMELDMLLDIHSSSSPTPPFAIVNNVDPAFEWASHLQVPFVVEAWDTLSDRIFTGVLERRGKPALTLECGEHNAPDTLETAFQLAQRFLTVAGIGRFPHTDPSASTLAVRVEETITKPSEDFRFDRVIKGFERLEAGTCIGRAGLIEIRVAAECYAILPNDLVPVGDDVMYLARAAHRVPTGDVTGS